MACVLTFGSHALPAADLGGENPLPDLAGSRDLHADAVADATVPPEDARYLGYGRPAGILPYTFQDGYGRERKQRIFATAVLRNERLEATFLPELGGRLWSLRDLDTGRDLVECNPVFQPANLAIRNAWFSGGVEWNVGVVGHTPFTCSPLFTAQLRTTQGFPVLRMYEWERIRGAVYQIDVWLPPGSRLLYVRARVENTQDRVVPMYWWSNIAVPQTPGTRVIVPAETCYTHAADRTVTTVGVPLSGDRDITYPTRHQHAADFFFRIPSGVQPFVAALDASGSGLVQTSTTRLAGRKLFVWGMGGGRRWQEFLSVPGRAYLEIQAGLARTQMEHIPMPGGAVWEWLEAYGPLVADPAVVHGGDWSAAWRAVSAGLDGTPGARDLESMLVETRPLATGWADVIRRGSPWAHLERARRQSAGGAVFAPHLDFIPAPNRAEHRDWMCLLEHGHLPARAPHERPAAWMVQEEWRELLERAARGAAREDWHAWLHLGVLHYAAGRRDEGERAWARSLEIQPNAWAARNLAVAARERGGTAEAARLLLEACRLLPDHPALERECAEAMIEAGHGAMWLDRLTSLPAAIRENGRMRFLEVRALLGAARVAEAESALTPDLVVADLREGETSLTDLWFEMEAWKRKGPPGSPPDEEARRHVRDELDPPAWMDYRVD